MTNLVQADWQVSIAPLANDSLEFLLGDGTPYMVDKFLGLSIDDVRTDDQVKELEHGLWAGLDLLGGRDLELGIVTFGTVGDARSPDRTPARVMSNQDSLMGAWTAKSLDESALAPTIPNMVLRYKVPGQPVRRFLGRCRKVNREDSTAPYGYGQATLQFTAIDPRQYADGESLATLRAGAATNFLLNPSAEVSSTTVIARTNLHPNPIAAVNATSFGAFGGTGGTVAVTRQTAQTGWWFATTSARATWSVATSAVSGGLVLTAIGGLVATRTYGVMLQVRSNKIQRVVLRIDWLNAASGLVATSFGTETVLAANTVTTLNLTSTAPATATQAVVEVYATPGASAANWAIADWLETSHVDFEETDQVLQPGLGLAPADPLNAVRCAFQGDLSVGSFGPDYTFGWAGTAHASASYMLAPSLDNFQAGASTGIVSSRSTEVTPQFGTYVARVLWPSGGPSSMGDAQTISGLTIGQTYTHSRYVYVPAGSPDVCLSIDSIGTSPDFTTKDAWGRISQTFVATSGSHVFRILNRSTAVLGDDRAYWEGGMVTVGSDLEPFIAAGGLTFPVTFPVTFSSTTVSDVTVLNVGNFSTQPTFTITGPITNPKVLLVETGAYVQVNLTLALADVLTIDVANRRVLLGTASRAYALAVGSTWPVIRPGTNTLRLSGDIASGDRPVLSVAWRSAWL
jgi:hypothetical protein